MNQILKLSKISDKHRKIYENLLKSGSQSASKIALKNGLKRGITYKILDDLVKIGLISEEKLKSKVFYSPNSPKILEEITQNKLTEIENDKDSLTRTISNFSNLYNTLEGKPNIQFLIGAEGLKTIYKDIIFEKTDIKIFRSNKDDIDSEIKPLIENQIEKQVENNINTKLISPIKTTEESDKKRKTTRRIISEDKYHLPAQIILYGKNKVAITSFDKYMISTLIESDSIKETFEQIFEIMWSTGTPPQYGIVED